MQAGLHTMITALTPNSLTNRPRTRSLMVIASLLCILTSSNSQAQPDFSKQYINSTLTASADPAPDSAFILAVNLALEDHWHTYWPGINDTGYGLSFDITPIEGLTFGKPYFPTPTRHLAAGDILDHVYEGQLSVLIPVTVSTDLMPGTMATINITTNALVCDEICIPQTTSASVEILITDYPVLHEEQLVAAYESRASKLTDPDVQWSTPETGAADYAATLTINNATHYQFFPADTCTEPADLIKQGDTKSPHLTISFDRTYDEPDDPVRFAGRLRVKVNNTWQEYDIDESIKP